MPVLAPEPKFTPLMLSITGVAKALHIALKHAAFGGSGYLPQSCTTSASARLPVAPSHVFCSERFCSRKHGSSTDREVDTFVMTGASATTDTRVDGGQMTVESEFSKRTERKTRPSKGGMMIETAVSVAEST